VSDDNRRAVLELEHPAQTGNVVSARAQRKLRRSELEAVGLQALNHAALAVLPTDVVNAADWWPVAD
jgi:hypothetical protein